SAPRSNAPVIGRMPATAHITPDDVVGADFDVIGSKDGWLLIRNVVFDDPAGKADRLVFPGPGWISGGLAGVQLAELTLKSAPHSYAPIVATLMDTGRGWGPDSFRVQRIRACDGVFLEVDVLNLDGKPLHGWIGNSCTSQLTTCDMGGRQSGASFDCAAARTPAEKMICADPQLQTFDQFMAEAFAIALAAVPRQAALRSAQARWLTEVRDKAPDPDV